PIASSLHHGSPSTRRSSSGTPKRAVPEGRSAARSRQDREERSAMISNESEYQEAARRLREEQDRLAKHRAHLQEMGLGPDEVTRAMDPLRAFHEQLVEEVESYERLKRGDIAELMN